MDTMVPSTNYRMVIDQIASLDWVALDEAELSRVAWAYYYFSIQFRESLMEALRRNPTDMLLQHLVREECDTDNLSPWPGVAAPGEKLNHDEFMRRTLMLSPIEPAIFAEIDIAGRHYLDHTRQLDSVTRAMSIGSYECGGLEAVFRGMLQAKQWGTPLLQGFRHFLLKHIDFDSNPDDGHGALIQHLVPDERIGVLWVAFHDLLIKVVPELIY